MCFPVGGWAVTCQGVDFHELGSSVAAHAQPSAMDVSAWAMMKGAVKCAGHCELQNYVSQEYPERKLCLGVPPPAMPISVCVKHCPCRSYRCRWVLRAAEPEGACNMHDTVCQRGRPTAQMRGFARPILRLCLKSVSPMLRQPRARSLAKPPTQLKHISKWWKAN